MKTIVLVTKIENGELGDTTCIKCSDYASARNLADTYAGGGYVGCIKEGDKIKRVF